MHKTAMVRARIDPTLKKKAEGILSRVGLSSTEFIRLAYAQVVSHRGVPFELKIPNAETRKAMEDIKAGRNVVSFDTPEEFYRSLGRK